MLKYRVKSLKPLFHLGFNQKNWLYDSYEGMGRLEARSIHSFWQQLSYK